MVLGALEPVEVDISHEVHARLAIFALLSGNLDMLHETLNGDKPGKMI